MHFFKNLLVLLISEFAFYQISFFLFPQDTSLIKNNTHTKKNRTLAQTMEPHLLMLTATASVKQRWFVRQVFWKINQRKQLSQNLLWRFNFIRKKTRLWCFPENLQNLWDHLFLLFFTRISFLLTEHLQGT